MPGPTGAHALPLRIRLRRMARRVGRTLWNDKVAAAHTVFYLVAAALFLPIVAGLFLFLKDTADDTQKQTAGLRTRAVQGLSQITGSSGLARYSADSSTSSYWESKIGPPANPSDPYWTIAEIGLIDERITALSFAKIDNLQRGGLIEDTTDTYVNYPEFKDTLRLGAPYDFHIRLYPVVENTVSDPYGVEPIIDAHVAYVANLTQYGATAGVGEWTDLSAQAQAEIDALLDLGLTATGGDVGFDGLAYQPLDFVANNPSGYFNLIAVKEGDVIGDTSMPYTDALISGTTKPYWQWFVEDYLFIDAATGVVRYDAVVFGSNVDLDRWDDPIAKAAFLDYLEAGGSLIFLGNENVQSDFIHDCTSADCLLATQGAGAPVTTPDVTNQMLTVPNALNHGNYQPAVSTDHWPVCDDERKGWIPVDIDGNALVCANTYFGASSSDRYGATGGTLILSTWDVPNSDLPEYFANMLIFATLRSAFLDYGPPIPIDASVESAERLMLVETPQGSYLDTKIVFYLWKNDCTPADAGQSRGENCIVG